MKKENELKEKILFGLQKTFQKLIEFKKAKKTELIVSIDGKVVRIKPEDL